ncbi:acid phosphatase type 7-like isoform X2 [Convolutriloba macropyga]
MFVTWSTVVFIGNGTVTYNEYSSANQQSSVVSSKTVNATVTALRHDDENNEKLYRTSYIFRATIVDLEPDTVYEYFVRNGPIESKTFQFRTFPPNENFKPSIAVYGDMGVENHVALDKLIQDSQKGRFNVVWHIGDFAYDMHEVMGARGDWFMNLIQPIAARYPYSVIPGNHETRHNFSEYRNRFTSPPPNVFFHSYNIGPIHLVMFNTEFYYSDEYGTAQLQTQYNWLIEDLKVANEKSNREQQPWIIAVGHRPMYCSSTHYGDCKYDNLIRTGYQHKYYNLENLFYQYGVDIQIYGHTHDYERMFPIYNKTFQTFKDPSLYLDPIYPVHFISGSPGNRELHPGFRFPEPRWSYIRRNDYGFAYVDVLDRLKIKISQYSIPKALFIDEFVVQKSQDYPNFQL